MERLLDRRSWAAALGLGLAFVVILLTGSRVEAAGTTTTILAGQSTPAGTVTTEVVGTDLVVTYLAEAGWEFSEAHLWVGTDLTTLPTNKAGNPQIGLFPYVSGDLDGATSWSVTIPLTSLGVTCGDTLLAAAHTAVAQVDGDGNTIRTETGWAEGARIKAKGSWATYFSFVVECPPPPPPVDPDVSCETAWAFGQQTFVDLDIATRWGWVVQVEGTMVTPIYAAAGGNNIANGTLVGTLTVVADGEQVTVSFEMLPGYSMDETHLYVGSDYPTTQAPGQLGYLHDLDDASSDTYVVSYDGSSVIVAAHAVVCGTDW